MNFGTVLTAVFLASFLYMNPPNGCVAPENLAASVKTVSDRDWNGIDETKLQSIWPTEIGGIQCNAGACEEMGRRDRMINDKCECCELFGFEVKRNDKGDITTDRLHSMMIYYSNANRKDLLADARMLAAAMGLSGDQSTTIGSKEQQHYQWTLGQGEGRQAVLLDVRVYREDGMWTVSLFTSRHPL